MTTQTEDDLRMLLDEYAALRLRITGLYMRLEVDPDPRVRAIAREVEAVLTPVSVSPSEGEV